MGKNDGGKARRTAFILGFEGKRNERLEALQECKSLLLDNELKAKVFVFGENRSGKGSFDKLCDAFQSRLVKPEYIKLLVFEFIDRLTFHSECPSKIACLCQTSACP